eukprot:snap_masked-scaffold_34-processed-gene-0.17-mRNA-1 protein AED:1.00 eAED:1.00 QI:0/-1/0/0/-1/1/1/0/312
MFIEEDEAFEILYDLYCGSINSSIPLRKKLSPINPKYKTYFAVPLQHEVDLTKFKIVFDDGIDKLLSVKFQGYHCRNMKVIWFERNEEEFCLVSRALDSVTRKKESRAKQKDDAEKRKHGFIGSCYTLLQCSKTELLLSGDNYKEFIIDNIPYLISYCKKENVRKRKLDSMIKITNKTKKKRKDEKYMNKVTSSEKHTSKKYKFIPRGSIVSIIDTKISFNLKKSNKLFISTEDFLDFSLKNSLKNLVSFGKVKIRISEEIEIGDRICVSEERIGQARKYIPEVDFQNFIDPIGFVLSNSENGYVDVYLTIF